MTAREVRATLDRLGINQSEAAHLCGVNLATMHRWCSERPTQWRQIPPPAVRLLYAMERLPELVGILEWREADAKPAKNRR